MRIINAAGVTVHVQKVEIPDTTIRLEHLPQGMYFFYLEKDGKTRVMKVMKN